MSWTLFLFCLLAFQSISPFVFQVPGLVKVSRGEMVTLKCHVEAVEVICSVISWYKMHPRTRELKPAKVFMLEQKEKTACPGVIQNVTVDDSGTYYCSGLFNNTSHIGNGSRIIVTEAHTQPAITLYTPDETLESSVHLQCLVFGVVPTEAQIFWVVGETALVGWTESGLIGYADSAAEFTRASFRLPLDAWTDDVQIECIVEHGGKNYSKSLKRGSNHMCMWILYLGSGSACLIILGIVICSVLLRKAKQEGATIRSAAQKSQRKPRTERCRAHTEDGTCATELQYASLDPISFRK